MIIIVRFITYIIITYLLLITVESNLVLDHFGLCNLVRLNKCSIF